MKTIGVAVMTLNAEKHIAACLLPWLHSPLRPRVLVVDSSSDDGTVALASALGADTVVIERGQFNHGTTREEARKRLATDIVVMVTPDAYAVDQHVLERLVKPILEGEAAAAYARQTPHEGADFFESFAREFNYPAQSELRSIEDTAKYGVRTFFCSNSCAAYCNRSLDAVGGFPKVLLGEDTAATAMLLRKGYKIAYVAEAVVRHSHRFTMREEFRRAFVTGLARAEYWHLLECHESDHKHGRKYVYKMLWRLICEKPHLAPYGFIQLLIKWIGYCSGRKWTKWTKWTKVDKTGQWTKVDIAE